MENKIIVYKNRSEMKILNFICGIIFIPFSIFIIIESLKNPETLSLFLFILFFIFILYIINRFKIVFNYKEESIYFTNYFSKTKIYNFSDIEVNMMKGNTTLPNDYRYLFTYQSKIIFKIASIDFVAQTKEKIEYLNYFLYKNLNEDK